MDIPVSREYPVRKTRTVYSRKTDSPVYDMHYPLELGIVLQGEVLRYCDNKSFSKTAGDMWFNGMWEPHGIKIVTQQADLLVLVIFPPWILEMQFDEAGSVNLFKPFAIPPKQRPSIPVEKRKEVLEIANKIQQCNYDKPLDRVKYKLYIQQLLLLALVELPDHSLSLEESPRQLNNISRAIDLAFSSKTLVTNDDGARACQLATSEFIRLFKKMMGVSFAKFSMRHRLRGAAKSLATTDCMIKEIADEWGFTDESHLYKLFLKHFNVSPGAYRKN